MSAIRDPQARGFWDLSSQIRLDGGSIAAPAAMRAFARENPEALERANAELGKRYHVGHIKKQDSPLTQALLREYVRTHIESLGQRAGLLAQNLYVGNLDGARALGLTSPIPVPQRFNRGVGLRASGEVDVRVDGLSLSVSNGSHWGLFVEGGTRSPDPYGFINRAKKRRVATGWAAISKKGNLYWTTKQPSARVRVVGKPGRGYLIVPTEVEDSGSSEIPTFQTLGTRRELPVGAFREGYRRDLVATPPHADPEQRRESPLGVRMNPASEAFANADLASSFRVRRYDNLLAEALSNAGLDEDAQLTPQVWSLLYSDPSVKEKLQAARSQRDDALLRLRRAARDTPRVERYRNVRLSEFNLERDFSGELDDLRGDLGRSQKDAYNAYLRRVAEIAREAARVGLRPEGLDLETYREGLVDGRTALKRSERERIEERVSKMRELLAGNRRLASSLKGRDENDPLARAYRLAGQIREEMALTQADLAASGSSRVKRYVAVDGKKTALRFTTMSTMSPKPQLQGYMAPGSQPYPVMAQVQTYINTELDRLRRRAKEMMP